MSDRLPEIVIGSSIVFLAFFTTLSFLEYLDDQPKPVYDLDAANPNWKVANDKTKAIASGKTLELKSDAVAGEYEFVTQPIGAVGRTNYSLSYDINISLGSLIISVFDMAAEKGITSKIIDQRKDAIRFVSPSDKVQVVLQNARSSPSAAVISKLSLYVIPNP
jgi:hypothetical protein